MSEKRYDTNGLYLTMVTAPKVLLRKVIKWKKNSFKQVIKFKKDFLGEQLNEVEMIYNLAPYSVI